ncbi:MAG: septum formation protein Maf [Candidatus Omnitrophica bacterium]|nr:septum formation protein Maf [Candidatus Omnitrophota bacterium]
MKKIILASCSPRRKQLLKQAGLKIVISPSMLRENPIKPKQDPVTYALLLALAKAESVARRFKAGLVIGADTIVVVNNKIFGKPKNQKHAQQILAALSGTTQFVYTAIAIIDIKTGRRIIDIEKTTIKTRKLSNTQIKKLSKLNHDKAGAYAIQKDSDILVKEMIGDYYNVVGLPIKRVASILKIFSIKININPFT